MKGPAPIVVALMILAGCTASAAPQEDVRRVVVTIEHSRFQPARFEFPRGQTVEFVIRNADPIAHEFIVGNERVQRIHEQGTERHHGSKPGEVSIPAGATRSTTYTFAAAGSLIVGCHLPAHYDYGMRAKVSVVS